MDELIMTCLPETFIAGVVYLSCELIRSLTAQLAHASVVGFQIDPTGGISIMLIARLLAIIASRPLDVSYPVFNVPELPPPSTRVVLGAIVE